jgi:hypothetical protein
MTPMQFMARLSALIPPPRHPLVRFYGVFAPHSKWRRHVGPDPRHREPSPCIRQRGDGDASGKPTASRAECPNADLESAHVAISQASIPDALPVPSGSTGPQTRRHATASLISGSAAEVRQGDSTPPPPTSGESGLSRIDWATLLRRVFDVDALECPSCGQTMRFVEVVESRTEARERLRARDLPDSPPPLSRARSPDVPFG